MITIALFLPLAVIFSYIATIFVRKALLTSQQVDIPNERSLHKAPVPRGGGLAVSGIILIGLMASALIEHDYSPYAELILASLLLISISWLDDKKGLSPALRLCAHLSAALIGSFALPDGTTLFADIIPFWLDRAIMIIGWAWFMNLYNFMDGIDGLTATQSICIMMGAAFILSVTSTGTLATYALIVLISGACLGFLLHNWHPAQIFLGDVGSVPLGFFIGYVLLSLVSEGYLLPALILPLYYLADSTYTLAKRALKGEKIWQAHRQHFYQKAALAIGRHDRVVIWIALGNSALVVAAVIATEFPIFGALAAVCITISLLVFLYNKSKQVP